MEPNRTYEFYTEVFKGESLPLAFVDLDLLDVNIQAILQRAGEKNIRIASKSVRSRFVLDHILQSDSRFKGIMCYTAGEASWLTSEGFDDLLIGYPTMNPHEIDLILTRIAEGKKIVPMIDGIDQAVLLNQMAGKKDVTVKICLDIDMSTDFPGLHFGVYRSPIHFLKDVQELIEKLKPLKNLVIHGIMGYEAQTAGVGDNIEGHRFKNVMVRSLKKRSNKDYRQRREEIVNWIKHEGYELELVNAGGTGSLELSAAEPWVTEVTVGSGFYSPGLFDHYSTFKHLPAAGFGLQIVRSPKPGYFTCLGGGYIASGETGILKQPYPYLPDGVKPLKNEGFGEVQTPFEYVGTTPLHIGSPVFFRHSKAGELCEHFNQVNIISGGKLVSKQNTYRGDGKAWL